MKFGKSLLLWSLTATAVMTLSSCKHPRTIKVAEVVPEVPEVEKKPAATKSTWTPPTRGLKNPDMFIPRIVPPGSRTKYSSAKVNGKYIAMTFDDGPHPTHTPRLLDMLKARNIKATFYVVAPNVKSNASIIRRMVAEGHEIGNHTEKHPNLAKMSDEGVRRELSVCAKAIHDIAGVRPRTMRPPFGAITERQRTWIYKEYGYPTILWNVDPLDWKYRNSARVARELVAGAKPGGILLAHDIHATTVSAMPDTLDRLLEKGFRFVTVTQLLALEQRASMAAQREAYKELGSGDFFGELLARRRVIESVRYSPDLSGFIGS